ncbi:MAG: YbbC/YhhH family protein [Prevotellaceae bacterium]|jgi:hypothetical protein|nr:YbbC/YhhH family protein [Prevotellaceae bacterium]
MKHRRIFIIISLLVVVLFVGYNYLYSKNFSYIPEKGFVPDEETAIKIAETIWYPIYGDVIEYEKPFNAELIDNVWIVQGTLKTNKGGAAYIEIQKKDCKILKVAHGK